MISIHQSQFLPWTPLFYKILVSDNFVVMDDVQFQKNGVQNRNLIKTPQGQSWLTIPVKFDINTKINEVVLNSILVYEKLLKSIELNYKKSPYFEEIFEMIRNTFAYNFHNLNELNNTLLLDVLSKLESKAQLGYTSNLNTIEKKDDLVIEIIKKVGDLDYLCGSGGLGYMDLEKFKKANIKVYTYKFDYKPYPQLWTKQEDFIKDLSILDLLFNDLGNARNYILSGGQMIRIV